MPIQPDVLSQLPLLSWRNLSPPPYDVVGFEWANELAPRAIPYLDVEVHDDVRRKSAEFKARLYFCEKVQKGAFTDLWPQWLPAIKTGSPDYFVHPLLGTLRARVKNVGGEVKARVRDGVIVDVTWIETLEDTNSISADLSNELSIDSQASIADQNATSVGISYPSGSNYTSISGAWDAIRGSVFSAAATISGPLNTLIANVDTMADDVDDLDSHTALPAFDSLVTCWNSLVQLQKKLAATARTTSSVKLTADTTLDSFALQVGNSLIDVMGANLQALNRPFVPKGATLVYYTS